MKMKKIKPIGWLIIAILVYFMFFKETETIIHEPDNDNPLDVGKKKCSGLKCKKVRRRGVLGFGRRVGEDWCSWNGQKCTCLGDIC